MEGATTATAMPIGPTQRLHQSDVGGAEPIDLAGWKGTEAAHRPDSIGWGRVRPPGSNSITRRFVALLSHPTMPSQPSRLSLAPSNPSAFSSAEPIISEPDMGDDADNVSEPDAPS